MCQGWNQLDETGVIPTARTYYSSATDPQTQDFLLFGGQDNDQNYNDLYRFSFDTYIWLSIVPSSDSDQIPSARYGQSSAIEQRSGDFLVFGGFSTDFLNDFWRYSFVTNNWTLIENVGSVPNQRYYHTSAIESISGDFLVFGGECSVDVALGDCQDFSRYSFLYGNWSQIISSSVATPYGRLGVSSQIETISGDFIVFGGYDGNEYFNDLWRFTFQTYLWSQISYGSPTQPVERYLAASAIKSSSGDFLMFGGEDANSYFNYLWSFSFNSSNWTLIDANSVTGPSARITSGTMASKQDSFFIFGGSGALNYLQDAWIYDFNVYSSSASTTTTATMVDISNWSFLVETCTDTSLQTDITTAFPVSDIEFITLGPQSTETISALTSLTNYSTISSMIPLETMSMSKNGSFAGQNAADNSINLKDTLRMGYILFYFTCIFAIFA